MSGSLKTQSTSGTPLTTGIAWGGTVEYNGAGQSVVAATSYNNLTLSNSGAKTLGRRSNVDRRHADPERYRKQPRSPPGSHNRRSCYRRRDLVYRRCIRTHGDRNTTVGGGASGT